MCRVAEAGLVTYPLAISPDGKAFVAPYMGEANEPGGRPPPRAVGVFDADTGAEVGSPLPHTAAVVGIQYAPDGRWFQTVDRHANVRRWGVRPGPGRGPTLKHGPPVWCVRFSRDSSLVLTATKIQPAE